MSQHPTRSPNSSTRFGAGHDVGVAAPHLDDDGRLAPRQVEVAQPRPTTTGRGGEDAQVIEVAAIREQPSVCRLAEAPARLRERVFAGADREHDVVLGDHDVGGGRFVPARPSHRRDLYATGSAALTSPSVLPNSLGFGERDFQQLQALGRGASIFGLSTDEEDVEQRFESRHIAERIGNRIADRRIVDSPTVAMAACSAGVLVPHPANRPSP